MRLLNLFVKVLLAFCKSLKLNILDLIFMGDVCNSNDVFAAFKHLVDVNEPWVVINHGNTLLKSTLLSDFCHITKGLSHDGNKHVHENYLNEERSKNENKHSRVTVISIHVNASIKIAKETQHVDRNQWIYNRVACICCKVWIGRIIQNYSLVHDIKEWRETNCNNSDHEREFSHLAYGFLD